jgi:broad specificity phosphatase PhoE
MMMGLSISGS